MRADSDAATAGPRISTILVIDDDPNNLAIVSDYLRECNFTILVAEDGMSGFNRALFARPDLILLDVLMPGMDGYETCQLLKSDDRTREIPVIFMTALAETEHKVRGFEAGAVDYITKPFQREEVLARVGVHLRIRELARRLTEANELLERRVEERTAELRNSERRLMEIINFLPDATFAVNLQGEVMIWNLNAEKLTGIGADQMLGRGNHEYAIPFYGERRPMLIDLVLTPSPEIEQLYPYLKMERGVLSGESFSATLRGGESYLMSLAAPLYDSQCRLVGAIEVVRDVTEQKRLEEQLRQAQKMEAVGTLAGGVAHDFNNILTGIIGYAGLLKLRMGEENPLASYPNDILAAAERAANLTKSLLSFSRRQPLSIKPEHLNEIVRSMDKFLLRIIGEEIDFKALLADDDLVVLADSGQLQQVLMNLATNARDAMPDGGTLTIRTEREDALGDSPHGILPPGAWAAISVADTGQGMDELTMRRIFDPFFTTKEVGKGTGLGLSIVYGIIKQHNGEIRVESEPGRGTTFTIYLRLVEAGAERQEALQEAGPAGGSETILVAEDDPGARSIMKQILEEYGYRVIEAVDGEDAVAKFREAGEEIQLAILDVVMPKKDGRGAFHEIRAIRNSIRALFTSGYSADVIEKKGIIDEGVDFIQKPVTPRQLLAKVREVLSR
jgi:PAS domain S-box-containing protein